MGPPSSVLSASSLELDPSASAVASAELEPVSALGSVALASPSPAGPRHASPSAKQAATRASLRVDSDDLGHVVEEDEAALLIADREVIAVRPDPPGAVEQ